MNQKTYRALLFIFVMAILGCNHEKQKVFTDEVANIKVDDFTRSIDNKPVSLYTLIGTNGIGMKVTNFGARVVALCVPDGNGNPVDVVLGYNTLEEYISNPENFLGAAIGRFGNRIAEGKFNIDSIEYTLPLNDGVNHLHGGTKGFFDVVWNVDEVRASKIVFTYLSKDGEQGYPGYLKVKMSYELTSDNCLKIDYEATSDKSTICNLTHHSYFNLSGEGAETINDHVLTIKANGFTPVDSTLIPTGEIAEVKGTPFDFTDPIAIGERVNEKNKQLKRAGGYDHNWVLNKQKEGEEWVCSIYSPISKINMHIITDQPGLQFYGGNFLNGTLTGKSGKKYEYRSAFCLETQYFPDSPNKPNFPSVQLNPGERYKHTCSYRFSVKK